MARQAIRNEGNAAEDKFIELVNNARLSDAPALGDAIVLLDGVDFYVEIKQCGTQGGTINQVRAIKYIPCVVWATLRNKWYILPPNRLVRVAAAKGRGQHTEIPFESMNISMPKHDAIPNAISCNDDQLDAGIRTAIHEGEKFPECRELMASLLGEIRALKADYIKRIEEVFE